MKTHHEAMTIALMWLLLIVYININAVMTNPQDECSLTQADILDGKMFCTAVTIVKMIELLRLKVFDIVTRLTLIFVVYVFVYGITAGPYMIVSFVQPFHRNVLAHFAILFLVLESITYHLQNRQAK